MLREIIFDIETTGLYVDEGERMVSLGMVELVNGQPSGRTFYALFNPERESSPAAFNAHRLTLDELSQHPSFATRAQEIRDFIGDALLIITCRTGDRNGKPYTLDIAFLENEMKAAGVKPPQDHQWINVRRWGEQMFGNDKARLDAMLDHYGIDRSERDAKGHGALLDAQLLAEIYPKLKVDYFIHQMSNPPYITFTPAGPKKPSGPK